MSSGKLLMEQMVEIWMAPIQAKTTGSSCTVPTGAQAALQLDC